MTRIAIIGGSGAGKTTLAGQIGAACGLTVHHIDQIYWQKAWVPRGDSAFFEMASKALSQESWVFDGFPAKFWESHSQTLDMIIFIDEPYPKRLWRVLARAARRRKDGDADISGHLSEVFRRKFVYNWLFGWHLKARKRCLQRLDSTPDNVIRVHLKGKKACALFFGNLQEKNGPLQQDSVEARLVPPVLFFHGAS